MKPTRKRKKICLILILFLLLNLPLYPQKYENNDSSWSSFTYKIMNWCHEEQEEDGSTSVYFETKIYFFPDNLKDYKQLKKEYYNQ